MTLQSNENRRVKRIQEGLKGKGVNSGFRLIYAHFENENRIVLVEIFHKSKKEIENKEILKMKAEKLANFTYSNTGEKKKDKKN